MEHFSSVACGPWSPRLWVSGAGVQESGPCGSHLSAPGMPGSTRRKHRATCCSSCLYIPCDQKRSTPFEFMWSQNTQTLYSKSMLCVEGCLNHQALNKCLWPCILTILTMNTSCLFRWGPLGLLVLSALLPAPSERRKAGWDGKPEKDILVLRRVCWYDLTPYP